MYIVAIAWLYVVVLMAALEKSVVGGLLTLFFYGLLPLSIVLFVFGTPERRRRTARREAIEADPAPLDAAHGTDLATEPLAVGAAFPSGFADQPVGEADGGHAKPQQGDLPDRG